MDDPQLLTALQTVDFTPVRAYISRLDRVLGPYGAPIESIFNRGPFPTSGGDSIVNTTGWDVFDSFEVGWLTYVVTSNTTPCSRAKPAWSPKPRITCS